MCYTGRCYWEGQEGVCYDKDSSCPTTMKTPCKCGCSLKQKHKDGKYYCLDCDKIIEE